MKKTSKRMQYITVLIITVVAVMVYLICYKINIMQPISVDKDKALDNFIRTIALDNSNRNTGLLSLCEYNIQNILMFLLINLCGDIWIGINIYYISTFFWISVCMYHFLSKLQIPVPVATGLSVLAAFLPFHIDRGEGQMMTSNFFLAPLFMSMFYDMIYCKKIDKYAKEYVILVCLAPFIDIRISIMACILFCILLIQRCDKEITRYSVGYLVVLILFSGFVSMTSSTMKIFDIELAKEEGMRILDMVMPMRYHIIGRLSNMRLDYDVMLSAHGECGLNSLGILFSIGFVCMMLGMFFGRSEDKRIKWMGMISMMVILIAGICGLGAVIEYFGVNITYWSRMAVFIIVCSVAVIGILIGNIYTRIKNRCGKWGERIGCAVMYIGFVLEFWELILRQNM